MPQVNIQWDDDEITNKISELSVAWDLKSKTDVIRRMLREFEVKKC